MQKLNDDDITVTIYPNVYTKSQIIEKHRKMWHDIARMTREEERFIGKAEYAKINPELNMLFNNCYACTFARIIYEKETGKTNPTIPEYCKRCPLKWNDSENLCIYPMDKDSGLYLEWLTKNDDEWERAAELAEKIAEIPEREII